MSGDKRDTPRTGNGRDAGQKVSTRETVVKNEKGQIDWPTTIRDYPIKPKGGK